MSETLISRYGNWLGVCQYYADTISAKLPKLNKEDFLKNLQRKNFVRKKSQYAEAENSIVSTIDFCFRG
jgi:hypothetical protein